MNFIAHNGWSFNKNNSSCFIVYLQLLQEPFQLTLSFMPPVSSYWSTLNICARNTKKQENLFFITCCVAFLYSVAMHTDLHWQSEEKRIKYNFPCFSCSLSSLSLFCAFLFCSILCAQFTITLKYDYILLTQLNIICISFFFRSCLNTFIMIIHIALQEVLLKKNKKRPAKMYSEKNSPLMMPLFRVVCCSLLLLLPI